MELKELRKQAGLLQREMAKKLNMTEQNYRNYELHAYVGMAINIERKISDIFGVNYKYPGDKIEGSNLKKLRINAELTQREMASKLGMTPTNYKSYELLDYKNMSLDLENKISDILGVSYKYSEEV